MKLTTGFDFQGYFITEYVDVIFDEILVGLGFGKALMSSLDNMFSALSGSEATEMIDKLNSVKTTLRDRVIRKAREKGANALIGIDFESSKLGDLIMVSMTATAVKIEKIQSPLPTLYIDLEKKAEEERLAAIEAEKQQRLDYLREHPNEFDVDVFIENVTDYETVKEAVAYIKDTANANPDKLPPELLKQFDSCAQLERMYGRGSGKKNMISLLKEHFGIQ